MLQHPGYELQELLQEREDYRIVRGIRRRDKHPVLLTFSRNDTARRVNSQTVLREYELLAGVHSPRVMTVLDLEQDDDGWFLVWEDFAGLPLASWLETAEPTLEQALEIGVALAEGLSDLHQQRIVHAALRPENILYAPQTANVKIWGTDVASGVSAQMALKASDAALRLDPAYLSPEQTGRMRREMDWRTDLYTLGLLLYRLIAGQLPFQAKSAQEWIHCHMAVAPLPLTAACPAAPTILGDLIGRLLEKDPECRYQSAAGVAYDLQHCLREWRMKQAIPLFVLASHDKLDILRLPDHFYGRVEEREQLLACLAKATQLECQTVLLTGRSGVGKSWLARELQWPVLMQGGVFGEGKFQELHRSLPYSGWYEACEELMAQLLAKAPEDVGELRSRLLIALGEGAALLADFLPRGEALLGRATPTEETNGGDAEKRLFVAVKRFFQIVAEPERPVVLFFDDLQWADLASLKLLREISQSQAALVVIAAYRENRLDGENLLSGWLEQMQQETSLLQLTLKEHPYEVTLKILEEVLGVRGENVAQLAELVYGRTQGNILFLSRFLEHLHDQGLLSFSREEGAWQWSLAAIRETSLADNVVGLMTEKVKSLPSATLELLILASCFGIRVLRDTLAAIAEKSPWQVAATLRLAVAEGLLLSTEYGYKFAHDRIQEVAYAMLEKESAARYHLQIARSLYDSLEPAERGKRIFELVDQWNLAAHIISEAGEIRRVMILNLEAGRRAKASAAYRSAYGYFSAGIALLAKEQWQSDYALALALYSEGAEAACLGGMFAQSESWSEIVLERGMTLLDRVPAYEVRIQNRIAQSRIEEAVSAGLEALAALDLVLPREVRLDEVWPEVDRVQAALGGRGMQELEELPRLTDLKALAVLRVLTRMGAPTYQTSQPLFIMVICRLVEISVTQGNSPYAAYGYVSYGAILAGMYQHVEAGYRFGRLALAVSKRYQTVSLRTKTLFVFGSHILHWREAVKESLPVLEEAYQSAWETGDFEYGGYAAAQRLQYAFYAGFDLNDLQTEMLAVKERLTQWGQSKTAGWNQFFLTLVTRLQGQGTAGGEEPLAASQKEATGKLYEKITRLIGDYLLREEEAGLRKLAEECRQQLAGVNAMYTTPVFHFYESLARLAGQEKSETAEDEVVEENQRRLWRWAQHAPENHLHKYYLVEAERLRIRRQWDEAGALYEQAASLAKQYDCLGEEALAWELGGRFFLARGRDVVGRAYLNQAHSLYTAWGALGKASKMRDEHAFIQAQSQAANGLDRWDWMAVLEASRVVAGERNLEELLTKMVRIVLENSGAQRVCFLSEVGDALWLEAEGFAARPPVISLQAERLSEGSERIPLLLLRYALAGQRLLWLPSAEEDRRFAADSCVRQNHVKSVLCLPMHSQGKRMGVLYLENNSARGVFTEDRIRLLEMLSTQMAVALENARLWREMEERVAKRTKALEEALLAQADSERSYRLIAEYAADVIWTIRPDDFSFTYASPSILRLTGWRADEVKGKSVEVLLSEESRAEFTKRLQCLTEGYQAGRPAALLPDRWDCRYLRADGASVEVENVVTLLTDKRGQVEGLLGISRDITERKALEGELVMLATTDMLTGIANRRHFVDQVQAELQRARRYQRPVALLVMDLDRFKDVNDTYGHPCGDEVLRQFTQLCRHNLRNSDHLGRLGGEEFAALLPETALPAAKAVAERIRVSMEENRVAWEGQEVKCTVSIGVTVLGSEEESWETFLGRADRALYTAKRSGRNRVDGL
ncbi:diguanylate cyclase [Azotosporobacter soli]|uniref:diguanylate cyclase n=1 Tax=Azotosporobacter soli TaxID=3055040 RepID=UPI0031FE9C76